MTILLLKCQYPSVIMQNYTGQKLAMSAYYARNELLCGLFFNKYTYTLWYSENHFMETFLSCYGEKLHYSG
jgi:hypothetical protein